MSTQISSQASRLMRHVRSTFRASMAVAFLSAAVLLLTNAVGCSSTSNNSPDAGDAAMEHATGTGGHDAGDSGADGAASDGAGSDAAADASDAG